MNKYALVFKTSFKQEKVTAFDTVLRAISFVLVAFILIQLWSYIYGDGGVNQVINGYSLEQMLWYLLVTEAIHFSARNQRIVTTIGNEVKSGSIAYKVNKPYNFYLYNITTFMANSSWTFLFIGTGALIVGFGLVGFADSFVFYQIIPCIISIFCSFLLIWALHGIMGLVSFWVEDATPFNWILSKFLMLFGVLFPVEFFPKTIQTIITYSPIYSIFSGPAKLVANFSWDLFFQVFISQIVWSVILVAIGLLVYSKGKKKVNVNGG